MICSVFLPGCVFLYIPTHVTCVSMHYSEHALHAYALQSHALRGAGRHNALILILIINDLNDDNTNYTSNMIDDNDTITRPPEKPLAPQPPDDGAGPVLHLGAAPPLHRSSIS